LGFQDHSGSLAVGSDYEVNGNYALPQTLGGSYYVFVVTDSHDYVFENQAENNNTLQIAAPIQVAAVHADLHAALSTPLPGGVSGQSLAVSWTVTNTGANTTAVGSWLDTVYLSSDNKLDDADGVLGRFPHNFFLAAGGDYPKYYYW
jgi:hypothetical protein